MSLIMDALKQAQQLRLKGSEEIPILKYPHSNNKRGRKSEKQWGLISAGLISLCILFFVLLKPASPPFAIQPYRAIIPMERIHSEAVPKKEEPLPTGQTLNRVGSGQGDTEGTSSIRAALRDQAFHESKPPINKKGIELPINQRPEREKLEPQGKVIAEKTLPSPPVSQKEESLSKSIGVEQEGRKDRTLVLDILNHFNSGVHFYNQREFSKAIQAYQKVIELDPTYIEAYNNLGVIYQMLGEVDRAFGFYQKSTEINPKYEKGYNNLGILFFLKGHYDEALEAFQKALTINSNNIESYINLGILYKKKGEGEKAIESYQKALAINPLHRETHYNIALLYEQSENSERAVSHYQQFIQLSSKSHPDLVSKVQRHLNAIVEAKRNKK
jgi:tetratricopeptide (TPR) repeat protein